MTLGALGTQEWVGTWVQGVLEAAGSRAKLEPPTHMEAPLFPPI